MEQPPPGRDLYALEPEKFTAARNAQVKQLRSDDRKDEASAVASLRRPPATAWALNSVARDRPELVQAVLRAGQRLRAAMERAVDGDASALRDAQLAERQSIDAVTAAAVGRLEETGRAGGDTSRRRMAATLRAAVVDATVADALVAGVLDADRDAPGFGLEDLAVRAPARQAGGAARGGTGRKAGGATPARTGAKTQRAGRDRPFVQPVAGSGTAHERIKAGRPDPEPARRQRLDTEADEAEQRARDTERDLAAAERRARHLRAAATAAAEEADEAARRARDLEDDAAAAERRAEQAHAEAEDAAARAASARHRAGRHG